jgi:predicted exporter
MINGTMPSSIIKNYPNALFIDPIQEYSILFSSYRQMMLLLVAALLIGFILIIYLYQGIRASLAVALPVVLSILTSIGIFGIFGIGFSMFHTMGLLLVLCIGIDYALFLYWRKPGEKEFLLLGNTLAAITTLLSFGLLALSSTAAIHSFGMTVFVGIVLNFLITTLFLGNVKCTKL